MTKDLSTKKPLRNPAVRWRKEGDNTMLSRGMILNDVGTFIWERCDGQFTTQSIIEEVRQNFAVEGDEDLEADVCDFLLDLYTNNLITLNS